MSRVRRGNRFVAGALILGITWSIVVPFVDAEVISAAVLASFKKGTVDAVSTASIRISGTDYRVQSDAKVMDHKENEITLEEVFLRSEAKFHLNKLGEIDMMIVMRPQ